MQKEEKKSVPIELSVWKEMQHEKTESGLDMYELVRDAWIHYKRRGDALQPPSRVSDNSVNRWGRHPHEYELLEYILERGSKDYRSWITGNLRAFCDAIQAQVERQPNKPESKRKPVPYQPARARSGDG